MRVTDLGADRESRPALHFSDSLGDQCLPIIAREGDAPIADIDAAARFLVAGNFHLNGGVVVIDPRMNNPLPPNLANDRFGAGVVGVSVAKPGGQVVEVGGRRVASPLDSSVLPNSSLTAARAAAMPSSLLMASRNTVASELSRSGYSTMTRRCLIAEFESDHVQGAVYAEQLEQNLVFFVLFDLHAAASFCCPAFAGLVIFLCRPSQGFLRDGDDRPVAQQGKAVETFCSRRSARSSPIGRHAAPRRPPCLATSACSRFRRRNSARARRARGRFGRAWALPV